MKSQSSATLQESLRCHATRSNYVAYIFQRPDQLIRDVMEPTNHGWERERKIVWSNECYPQNVSDLLLDDDGKAVCSDNEADDNGKAAFGDDLDDDLENVNDFV